MESRAVRHAGTVSPLPPGRVLAHLAQVCLSRGPVLSTPLSFPGCFSVSPPPPSPRQLCGTEPPSHPWRGLSLRMPMPFLSCPRAPLRGEVSLEKRDLGEGTEQGQASSAVQVPHEVQLCPASLASLAACWLWPGGRMSFR